MSIYIVGEGWRDVGDPDYAGEQFFLDGVLPVLVRRILEECCGRDLAYLHFESQHLVRLQEAGGYERKVAAALRRAQLAEARAAVIVVDRDRTPGQERLHKLREGRSQAQTKGLTLPLAVGVAIETMEAWLLADEQAIVAALDCGPIGRGVDPESLRGRPRQADHPKVMLQAHVEHDKHQRPALDCLRAIAEVAELNVIRDRCPSGFQPFYEEVRQFLAPLF